MFHLRFGLSDHLKALLDFVFGSRRRVKKVRIFRAWFSHGSGALPALVFFWLVAAWVKSRAERPSVSGVNRQLHVQIGCKLGIRNRKDELTKQAKRNKLQIEKPEGN